MNVDVIIRTLAEAGRRESLLRALDSLTRQSATARPIVVVNGDRFDDSVLSALREIVGVRLLQIKGNLQDAMLAGRAAVQSEYFLFLDDDDLYLPSGIDALISATSTHPEKDLIISNGYVSYEDGHAEPIIAHVDATREQPLQSLRYATWLYPAGAIFKALSFTPEWFEDSPPMFEWTWIAYKSIMHRNVGFIEDFTFIYNRGLGTLSGTERMTIYEDQFLQLLPALGLPMEERHFLGTKHRLTLHAISDYCLHHGRIGPALIFHVRSLLKPGGWRHLPYSRYFLRYRRG